MTYDLELLLSDQPAALERVLQTARYRGFKVRQLQMRQRGSGLQLSMQVSGPQPINILTTQLHKLYDLASLNIEQTLPQTA
ncbi:acetolactate synthase 2 small subunit [Lacimicrobium sp. SS2-24]|uniref:acetolactate synthase 2 small subunit n=1 Tax=Lacimicrobium sp. SS2-24 TaxID=2005569 RepID=UPI000B4BEE7C|nr:acetolactate synthase 2 small subunit [Lacimicrobium sp. SS2-24]